MGLFDALFKTNAANSMSPINAEKESSTPTLTHVRANLEEQWVSAQDALHYIRPGMSEKDIAAKIDSLPRALYVIGFWPPTQENKKLKDSEFKGVKFANLHLLLEGDDPNALRAVCTDFVADMGYAELNPGTYPMVLATDARMTQAQKRYEKHMRYKLNTEWIKV